ncbi:MAG: Tn3 family transposase [Acidimicrobiia bacterium]
MFALAWTLGYRWAPRLTDLPDQRLWRIDPNARYGALNGLARFRINTRLIADNWDQICRLAACLRARTVTPSAILRTLQRGPNPSPNSRSRLGMFCAGFRQETCRDVMRPGLPESPAEPLEHLRSKGMDDGPAIPTL